MVVLVVSAYSAGLPGGFLLDDIPNLKTLERLDGPFTWAKLGSFVYSNQSGDLGRLLPLLSLAAQHPSWPGNPAAFKAVNIGLHAFNAVLVWWLALKLAELARGQRDAAGSWMAVWVSGLWALHPLLVSTVLYTVQRMAIMAAMFMLLGLAMYLTGRRRMARGERGGIWLMALGVIGGSLLATACKENGALLPLVVLVVELTLLARLPRGGGWSVWLVVTVLLPLGVLFGYIGYRFESWILPGYALRDYSLAERLMTEARVLCQYLAQIVVPRSSALGLFHDDFPVSRSLAEPTTTLPALLLVAGLCAGAIALRNRLPALSMGVLWYFGAQVLESGPIPLELYFEHRNYFPMVGLLLGVGVQMLTSIDKLRPLRRHGRYVALAAAGWLVMSAGIAFGEINLWSDPYAQAAAWARERPSSIRAQSHWARVLGEMRFIEAAEDVYDALTARDPGYRLVAIKTNCQRSGTRFHDGYDEVLERMRTMKFTRSAFGAIEGLVVAAEEGRCLDASRKFLEPTVAVLLDNPNLARHRFDLLVLQGRFRVATGRYRAAHQDFVSALSVRPDVEVAMLAVKAAYLEGDRGQAELDLGRARAINGRSGLSRWTYGRDIDDWALAVEAMRPNTGAGEGHVGGNGSQSSGESAGTTGSADGRPDAARQRHHSGTE